MRGLIVEAGTASELVARVLGELSADGGDWDVVAPRGMATRELRNCRYTLTDVSRCATWLPKRGLNYSFMVAEFIWMFCGRDDVEMISHYNDNIRQFSDDGKTFWGAYGMRWREQISGVLRRLRADETTRQAIACTWRPEYNKMGNEGAMVHTKDVPCTVSMQYLLRGGKLSASVYMRSSDAWLGVAYDIFNFASLQRALARELEVEDGDLTLHIGSSHLYERDLPRVREVLEASPTGNNERSRLEVPSPPGLECQWLNLAEEAVRKTGWINDVGSSHWVAWYPYLELLSYRKHKDYGRIVGVLRELVRP